MMYIRHLKDVRAQAYEAYETFEEPIRPSEMSISDFKSNVSSYVLRENPY